MAIYSLENFKLLVKSCEWTYFNEQRPHLHLRNLEWSDEELANVLCSLTPEDFRKSVMDQIVRDLPGRETVNTDNYVINWDREEWVRRSYAWVSGHNFPISTLELFFKIAIVQNETGQLAGVVSFHPSNSAN
jgi:hypothetical protein